MIYGFCKVRLKTLGGYSMPNGYLAEINDVTRTFKTLNGGKPKQYGGLQFVGIEDVTLQQP